MVSASVVFIFSDSLAKYAAQFWPVGQILTIRGLFSVLIGVAVVIVYRMWHRIGALREPIVIGRSLVEGFTTITFISALPMMPIADLTSILMLSPLVITALAIVVYGEVVGWRRWSAIVAGFAGMLLIVQPSGGATAAAPQYFLGAALGLCAVFGVAVRDIITRKLNADIPSVVVTVGTSLGAGGAGLVLSMFQPWAGFAWVPFLCCVVAAAIVTAGNFLVVLACREADLSLVAPYRFSAVIWAIMLGALVFGEYPGWLSLVGMAIIVASGVYTLHRERVRRREAQRDKT